MPRLDGRKADQLRPVTIKVDEFRKHDVLISYGATTVYCFASLEERVPSWLVGAGCGWVTGEYNMMPSSSEPRQQRERQRIGGRTFEIQRLIGRSLRAALDLSALPPLSLTVDCDVLVADGGTRTASITGGMIALANLLHSESRRFKSTNHPLKRLVAAVSCGMVKDEPVLDLNYVEDRDAQVDANIIGLSSGGFAEVQATNEHGAFDRSQLNEMLSLAEPALSQLYDLQRKHIKFDWV